MTYLVERTVLGEVVSDVFFSNFKMQVAKVKPSGLSDLVFLC